MNVKPLTIMIMANLRNSVQLIGRLWSDPEIKTFKQGKKFATMRIATNETYTNQKGEKVKDTQWHTLVLWGKQVSIVENYLKKGSEVVIEGKLVHRAYETASGEKRNVTEISVNDLVLVGGKP
jgi:single-strand DNA-binding protein